MATAGAVVDRLLRRLASGARRSELPSDIDQHVAHFGRTLSRLRDVLASVERYFWVRTEVQDWMTKINRIVYDLENLLDEFEDEHGTESPRSGCITEAASLCSPCPIFLYSTKVNKMKTLRKRLDHLARNSVIFTMMQQPRCDLEQPDIEEEFCRAAIVGRDSDKTKIEELMLQNNAETLCIIPIVGLVGLGKTTLARLIFYDQAEGWNFDLRIWIDLNRKFDLRKIAADIISQADETKEDGPSVVNTSVEIHENLQLLKNRLQERLHGKSCLIIFDGLCSTDKSQLDELMEMLRGTNKWIKVLVTTFNEITAELMHTSPPYKLLPLSEDDCWTVFTEKAFGGGGGVNAHLKTIGKQIAKRCGGIPALAHFLGSVVHNQVMSVWLAARDEPIWKLGKTFSGKTKVFSSLNQIYYDMPLALKLCFLYLSIFPKGSVIDKEKLIRQWIALELIGSKHETLPPYVHGEIYIQDLLSIHFLQVTNTHSVNGMENRTSPTAFCVHNFVHDFARHLACSDIIILDDREMTDNGKELPFQYVLLTYCKWQSTLCSSLLGRARALHVLNTEPIMLHRDAFELLKHLRVLNLSRSCIGEIPTSIGRLKHLRYLDISSLKVQVLPSSMSMLINLEGLDLSNTSIQELPSFIGSLQKLKYLNLQGCDMLQNLPATLGHLQTLEHLRLSCCYDVSELVDSLCKLHYLRFFDLSNCTELPQLSPSFGNLMNLENLNLSSCFNLKQLPESFGNLYFLRFLNMSSCYELKQLPVSLCNLLKLEILILRRCRRLQNLPPSFRDIQNLRILDLTGCEALYVRIGMLPTNLEHLNLQQCLQLRPNRFSNLTRLKFLNLSRCLRTIDCLQSLGYLFNLEYLNLSQNLLFIPVSFLRLQKLHTLDLTGCAFKHPSHSASQMLIDIIHKMTGLKFLLTEDPVIVAGLPPYIRWSVGIDEHWHITTDELVIPDLPRGSWGLRIAERANLQNRPELRFLKLEWSNTSHPAVHGVVEDLGEEVLEKLQPHMSLEHFELARYSGFVWPTWMMNNMATLLPNLVSLHLFFLGNCEDLPPLGQLLNLRHLHIKDMPNLVNVEMGLSGCPQPFKKLTHLKLESLLNLEELPILSTTNNGNQQFMFLALEELSVLVCPNLMFKPSLPKCVKYEIKNSNRILSCGEPLGPLSSPSPVKIMITGCRIYSSWLQWLESLKTTEIIIIGASVGDDGEAVTSLELLGIKCTQESSSSKIPNETTDQSSSGTNILHDLTTQDDACKNSGHVVDSSGRQSSGQSSLLALQQNPATTGLGTSIARKFFSKFNTSLGQSVQDWQAARHSSRMENMALSRRNSYPKVHNSLCSELTTMLDKVSSILPSIEAARPGCRAGIQELCNLYNVVEKGKLITQHCIECSKLYLAITGEAILSRCERVRDSLKRSLFLIQNMVPTVLANQIAEVHNDLRDVKFVVDALEEEAGKAILEMLRQSDATEELELQTFMQAASKLNLTSPKAILIERRAIKKLLDKISGTDPKKEQVLKFLMYLVKKYGKNIKPDTGERSENLQSENQSSTSLSFATSDGSTGKCYTTTDLQRCEYQSSMSGETTPPAEFCCPISTKLMHDPVIITSGQTYEREYIEKWFSEGYNTCPRTQIKLENFAMIPNTCMRDLICNWCKEHGFTISDFLPNKDAYSYFPEQLNGYSMSSLHNVSVPLIAGNARNFAIDHSISSTTFSDASYVSDSSHVKDESKDSFSRFSWSADYHKHLSFQYFNQGMFLRFFCELSNLPLEIQGSSIKDLKDILDDDNEVSCAMVSNGFVEAFLEFLINDSSSCSMQGQQAGLHFFSAFLSNSRTMIPSMNEEAFHMITSFLSSELKTEALLVLCELVRHLNLRQSRQMASVVTPPVLEILASEDIEGLELPLKIICDLSFDADVKSDLISLGIISKLVPILTEGSFVECCLKILQNLCDVEGATALITRTDRCLGSVAEYLDTGSPKEQELAAIILLAICSRSTEDCSHVMREGVIPALVDLSVNGIDEAKTCSFKLLNLLRDLREDHPESPIHKQQISKSSGFFQRKMNIFSKPRSLTLF